MQEVRRNPEWLLSAQHTVTNTEINIGDKTITISNGLTPALSNKLQELEIIKI